MQRLSGYLIFDVLFFMPFYGFLSEQTSFPLRMTAITLLLKPVITNLLALLASRKSGKLSIDGNSIRWKSGKRLFRIRRRKQWVLNGRLNIQVGSEFHGLNINESSLLGSEGLWDPERAWLVAWLKTHAKVKEVQLEVASTGPEVTETPEALDALRSGKNVSSE